MRHRFELPIFIATALVFAAYAGCSGDDTEVVQHSTNMGGAGGASTTSGTTTSSTTKTFTSPNGSNANSAVSVGVGGEGGGVIDTCNDSPNGICEPSKFEDCNCSDCTNSALCVPDQCTTDGFCSVVWDSCICPDCDASYGCADPAQDNCINDGVCDSHTEGCVCEDCQTKTDCLDNVAACTGGAPDGACDLSAETCACVDCFGRPGCVKCVFDGVCGVAEPCYCQECKFTPYCSNPANCLDDGICDAYDEGCQCEDCSYVPECGGEPFPTTGSSGVGGMGGM